MRVAIFCFVLGVTPQLHSQGYLVPNGVYKGSNVLLGYEIDVVSNPANSDYTGFFLIPQGKTPPSSPFTNTFSFSYYLDEGVRVFSVSPNDPVSLTAISTGSYTELLFPNTYIFNSGIPFYVGLYTGPNIPVNGIYDDPLFGWALLVNNAGVIELLDSALVYNAQGIYAGTQTIIPEPGMIALVGLGGSLLLRQRRRS